MKFSARTIQILRNFSTINSSLVFKPGNTLRTISQGRSILAKAEIEETIDKEFAIYDLSQFLSAISLFEQPELVLGDRFVEITSGGEKIRYQYAEASLIFQPPAKELALPSSDVEFHLKNEVLSRVIKALGIIGSPELAVSGDRNKVYLEALNTKDSSDSSYRVEVGETDKQFQLIYFPENMKLLPGDYDVSISKSGISQFKTTGLEYWITIEQHSTYKD